MVQKSAKIFSEKYRVYIEDTDAGGIMYYVNYLKFMERARSDFFRKLGYQKVAVLNDKTLFVVRSCQVDYLLACQLDDLVTVTAEVESLGGSSVHFRQRVILNQKLATEAKIVIVCVDKNTLRPRRVSTEMRKSIQSYG